MTLLFGAREWPAQKLQTAFKELLLETRVSTSGPWGTLSSDIALKKQHQHSEQRVKGTSYALLMGNKTLLFFQSHSFRCQHPSVHSYPLARENSRGTFCSISYAFSSVWIGYSLLSFKNFPCFILKRSFPRLRSMSLSSYSQNTFYPETFFPPNHLPKHSLVNRSCNYVYPKACNFARNTWFCLGQLPCFQLL